MLALKIEVPAARDRTAIATLRNGLKTVATDNAVASATPALAAQHGNPGCDPLRLCGHPPLGAYRLLNQQRAQPDQVREYGSHILLFEPESGQALEAESFGRLALLAYGGVTGRDKAMRRTQGGLRLSDKMLHAVVSRLSPGGDMKLELVPLRPRSWWQFWKPLMETQPLSSSVPTALELATDELSLLETMLRKSVRRVRRPVRETRDDTFDRNRDSDRSSSGTSSSREAFQGKGGETGGGGASGAWSERGVDSSGRIIAGAAAVGAVGAIAAMAAGSGQGKTGDAEGGSAASSDAGSSSSADTTTSTSY
jgi:hypothetical protein